MGDERQGPQSPSVSAQNLLAPENVGGGDRVAVVGQFDEDQVEAIARVLGDTDRGLTGSEIGRLLAKCGIDDPYPSSTKRDRLAWTLSECQRRDHSGKCVVQFVLAAMSPVRWTRTPESFEAMRSSLNEVLSFSGLQLGPDGQLRPRDKAKTLSAAQERTRRMRDKLASRDVHAQVLRFCQPDLLREDCFDAVFEASKGLFERIREMTSLELDGAELVDKTFLGESPMLAFNSLRTQSERSEQSGLANLMKGIFGTFRNPAAHAPKVRWPVSEPDALDLLSTLSLIHRRLDAAAPPIGTREA